MTGCASDERGAEEPPRGNGAAARAAFVSASLGLAVGAVVYAALGTAKTLLSPGLDVESPVGWIVGPIFVFEQGLIWGLLGGAVVLLPPTFLACLALARCASADGNGPHANRTTAIALFAVLFVPLFALGLRGRVVDGLLLGVAISAGVRRVLRELSARLAPR